MNSVRRSFGSSKPEHDRSALGNIEDLRGLRRSIADASVDHRAHAAIAPGNAKMVAEAQKVALQRREQRASQLQRSGTVTSLQEFAVSHAAANTEVTPPASVEQQQALDAWGRDDLTPLRSYIASMQSEEPPRDVAA